MLPLWRGMKGEDVQPEILLATLLYPASREEVGLFFR